MRRDAEISWTLSRPEWSSADGKGPMPRVGEQGECCVWVGREHCCVWAGRVATLRLGGQGAMLYVDGQGQGCEKSGAVMEKSNKQNKKIPALIVTLKVKKQNKKQKNKKNNRH